jgi:hypothetical protein
MSVSEGKRGRGTQCWIACDGRNEKDDFIKSEAPNLKFGLERTNINKVQ